MKKKYNQLACKIKKFTSFKYFNDIELVMSGTTAIDFAIQDILIRNPEIKDAYLPSYRCNCIDIPFKDNNLNIHDYEIGYNETECKFFTKSLNFTNCILFLCDFFIHSDLYYKIIDECKDRNVIIIYDITHTFFNDNLNLRNCDYVVASLRKWFKTVDGGIALGVDKFLIKSTHPNRKYLFYKKLDYMLSYCKGKFFKMLKSKAEGHADKQAEKYYRRHKMSKNTIKIILKTNIMELVNKRKENLKKISALLRRQCLKGVNSQSLLSYPFLYDKQDLDDIIRKFRASNIRCATFWNKSDFKFEKNICVDLMQEMSIEKLKIIKKIIEG